MPRSGCPEGAARRTAQGAALGKQSRNDRVAPQGCADQRARQRGPAGLRSRWHPWSQGSTRAVLVRPFGAESLLFQRPHVGLPRPAQLRRKSRLLQGLRETWPPPSAPRDSRRCRPTTHNRQETSGSPRSPSSTRQWPRPCRPFCSDKKPGYACTSSLRAATRGPCDTTRPLLPDLSFRRESRPDCRPRGQSAGRTSARPATPARPRPVDPVSARRSPRLKWAAALSGSVFTARRSQASALSFCFKLA